MHRKRKKKEDTHKYTNTPQHHSPPQWLNYMYTYMYNVHTCMYIHVHGTCTYVLLPTALMVKYWEIYLVCMEVLLIQYKLF